MNIQSNALRSDYMRDAVNRTINEIHDDISTVFGPYAADAFITKNGQPYYTRDGKEVLQSMMFDNELATYIQQIMFQAVHNQGTKIGDGTTSLIMLYTNLYKAIQKSAMADKSISVVRPEWNAMIKYINETIRAHAIPLTDDLLKSAMFTCTQDQELVYNLYTKLKQPILDGAFIMVSKSNIEDDFVVTVHNEPLIKATKQYSLKPIDGEVSDCVFLHCNGMLSLAHADNLLALADRRFQKGGEIVTPTYVILCNGITDVTRRTLKDFIRIVHDTEAATPNFTINDMANVAIYTIDEYRSFSNDQTEDLSTMITDMNGIGGLVQAVTWESLLYQSCAEGRGIDIEELKTYDHDASIKAKMEELLSTTCNAVFDPVNGIRIQKELGPVAQLRYNELRAEIDNEKSEVKKTALRRRLRTMYGQFIDVEIGSKLIKDSQRKYELILDSVVSSLECTRHGVLITNSILQASKIIDELYMAKCFTGLKQDILEVLRDAFALTFIDMIKNAYGPIKMTADDYYNNWLKRDITRFDLKRGTTLNEALPEFDTITDETIHHVTDLDDSEISLDIKASIVEPVTVITNLLENSTTAVELALAKTFHMSTYMQNYI